MITNNTLSDIGDVLIVNSQVVVHASISVASFIDSTTGTTATRFFTKTFRYSLDGVNYSDWLPLTNANLTQVNGIAYGLVFFEFRYLRAGTDNTGLLTFNNIELIGNIQFQLVTNTSTFNSLFEKIANNDFYTMAIRNNILRKIFHYGILPKFIERGENNTDEDFLSFWSAVCLYLSYFSAFAEEFDGLVFNKEYLIEYIKQANIQTNEKEITFNDIFYISTNFYDEVRKRGTKMTLMEMSEKLDDTSVAPIDGEWLRLICKVLSDEFLYEVIKKENSGFCLGKSSPLYNGTYFATQLNKTEENTPDFIDLTKYTLIGAPTIATIDSKKCLRLTGAKQGLGYDLLAIPFAEHLEKLIRIDENMDYEITFNYRRAQTGATTGDFIVGLAMFNDNGIYTPSSVKSIRENIYTNEFINVNLVSVSKIPDTWYSFRGILYAQSSSNVPDGRTNLNKGQNLKISSYNVQEIGKAKICLYVKDLVGSVLYIHNLKMRPLIRGKNSLKIVLGTDENSQTIYAEPYIKNPQFLQSNTFFMNWRRNRNQDKSENQVDNYIQNYLLPYQQKLISIPISPKKVLTSDMNQVVTWTPFSPVCTLDPVYFRNDGFQKYLYRARVVDGVPDGYVEENLNGIGFGTYFPPVQNLGACPVVNLAWRPIQPYCETKSVAWRPIQPFCETRELLWRPIQPYCEQNNVVLFPDFDWLVVKYSWLPEAGDDLDTLTGLVDTGTIYDKDWVGWGQGYRVPESQPTDSLLYLHSAGDNTQTGGIESILVNLKQFITDFPATPNIVRMHMRGHWFTADQVGITQIAQYEIIAYKGGNMYQQGYEFLNDDPLAEKFRQTFSKKVLTIGGGNASETLSTLMGIIEYDKTTQQTILIQQ